MFINYIKIIFRKLNRQKLFSVINIVGLAVGLACTILILLWVQDELSFDKFNKNADRICRVIENQHYSGGTIFPVAVTPGPLAKALTNNYPEIESSARFDFSNYVLRYRDKIFTESVAFADPEFLKIFTYPLERGNSDELKKNPFSILMTKAGAEKYYGKEDPVGKTITIADSINLTVAGILKDIPGNSHLKFDYLTTVKVLKNLGRNVEKWYNNSFYTYVLLKKNIDVSRVGEKIKDEIKKNNKGSETDLALQPLLKIHLYSAGKYASDIAGLGNIEYVKIFSLIAFIILFIACINFMNLSTARATKRAKEVGMRKVVGAGRSQIIKQFYLESIFYSIFAFIIAMLISDIMLKTFNNLAGKEISLSSMGFTVIFGLIFLTIFTGIVAGSYPALYLSSFLPAKVLKSDSEISGGAALFRKILVVTQFSLSVILIIGTIVISSQLDYIKNKDLGFNRENVVGFRINKSVLANIEAIKHELKKNSGIISVTAASTNPTYVKNSTSSISWQGKNSQDMILMHYMSCDKDFINTFNMKMAAGRFFSPEYSSDTTSIVINEEAAKITGIDKPVGKYLDVWGNNFKIIGIVKNFNFKPLETKIEPLILLNDKSFISSVKNSGSSIYLRLKPGDLQSKISFAKDVYKKLAPSSPFNYHFIDEDFDNLYKSETRMQIIFRYFTIFAIIISCLGLFGLASYIAERRTKEIGIRKVLGANVFNLTYILSLDFTKWVLISNLIAWPIAYYFMNNWLKNYAYRINMPLWAFPLSGLLVLLVAVATVSYQAIKVALINPVKSLKYE